MRCKSLQIIRIKFILLSLHVSHRLSSLPFLKCSMFRDPQDDVPFAKILYNSIRFAKSLYNSLNDDGVIVFQVGASPDSDSGSDESIDQMKAALQKNLETIGFHSMHLYEEVSLSRGCNIFCNIKFKIFIHPFAVSLFHFSSLVNLLPKVPRSIRR